MSLTHIRGWTLRGRIFALCLTAGLLLGGLGVAAAITAASANNAVDVVLDRAGPLRVAGQNLGTALVDQETGIRGYAITGLQKNLEPYDNGVIAERERVAEIRKLLEPGDTEILASLERVEQFAAKWRAEVAAPLIETVRNQGTEAAQQRIEATDTRDFDQVRGALDRLQADILTMRDKTAAAARSSSGNLVVVEIAAAIVILVTGVLLLLLLDRLVSRPILDLAGQVRKVAAGDYERHIESDYGSPDLVALAEDVDRMRRQIANELSEVRLARQQVEWINQQLQSQAEELTRSNRDLEQFAYVASHDLQEPLRKVASFCQLLQRRYAGQLDDRADQYIGFAVDGAQRMQRLINDLLAFSRIGRLTSGFTEVDLNRVLGDVKSQLEARADADAEIIWAGLPTVEGEEPLLTTLFANLVGNSLKFRRPDVPPVVTITATYDEKEWRINVRDNGIGIEAEFADKVFVIFQRLHARDAYEGTGIGLAIVKKIVEYHGGRIWLDVDVSPGASIWFTLPVMPGFVPVPASESVPALESPSGPDSGSGSAPDAAPAADPAPVAASAAGSAPGSVSITGSGSASAAGSGSAPASVAGSATASGSGSGVASAPASGPGSGSASGSAPQGVDSQEGTA